MNDLLETIGSSSIGLFMAENPVAFPVAETIHVMAITTVLGLILIVDLRLVGIAATSYRVSRLTHSLLPATWIAFALALVTGALLFCSNPVTYVGNFAFQMKMLLIAGAGVNMAVFHLVTMRDIGTWDAKTPPGAARFAGLLSIAIWVLVAAYGRWIGFTVAPF